MADISSIVPLLTGLLLNDGAVPGVHVEHPANGSFNVPLDTVISVASQTQFSSGAIPSTPLVLRSPTGTVTADLVISDNAITVVPDSFLEPGTRYTVEVAPGVGSIIPGLQPNGFSFTTGNDSIVGEDLAMFREYRKKLLEWGPKHHANRLANPQLFNQYSEVTPGTHYYDATYGYYATRDFVGLTGLPADIFQNYAVLATTNYRNNIGDDMQQPGRRIFATGLYHDYINAYEPAGAVHTINVLRNDGTYSGIDNPASFIGFSQRYLKERHVRSMSYYLEALLAYERVGAIADNADAVRNIDKINIAKDALIAHVNGLSSHQYHPNGEGDGWTFKFTQPFMTGLAADALVDYIDWLEERRGGLSVTTGLQTRQQAVAEILPVLTRLGDWLFDAVNWVVVIPTTGLNVGDTLTFSSNIATFSNGATTRTRLVNSIDLTAGEIKQVMPFASGANPSISVTGPGGVIAHSIEDQVIAWIPEVGGSPGAWNDQGGSGLGGAFRYVIPTADGPNGTNSVGGTGPSVDLNMLMLSLLGFLYQKTCDEKWKTRGDAVFDGGVKKAFWASTKQYNQQLKNTFGYFEKRATLCD